MNEENVTHTGVKTPYLTAGSVTPYSLHHPGLYRVVCPYLTNVLLNGPVLNVLLYLKIKDMLLILDDIIYIICICNINERI